MFNFQLFKYKKTSTEKLIAAILKIFYLPGVYRFDNPKYEYHYQKLVTGVY